MADLIVYLPNHGYSNNHYLYVSWLDGYYYVADRSANSFKLVVTSSGSDYVQYTETITDGYVRRQSDSLTTSISGLEHLEGEYVYVTSGGVVVGSGTVTNGSIAANTATTSYQVGLPYAMKIRTMKLAVPVQGDTMQSRIKKVREIVTRFIRAKNGKHGVEYGGTAYLSDIGATFSTEPQDSTSLVDAGFNTPAYLEVTSTEPYPITVLALIADVDVVEK